MEKLRTRDIGYDFIRCTAMMLIVVYHFVTTFDTTLGVGSIIFYKQLMCRHALSFGAIGVCLFFMLSGAVLLMTSKDNIKLKDFYKKRLLKISIPQWISFTISLVAIYTVDKNILHTNVFGIIISFLGLNYCGKPWNHFGIHSTPWITGEWFTAVIIYLYLLFPLLKYLFKKARLITTIIISLIFLVNLKLQILSGCEGWFSISNGLMAFWAGMLFQEYKQYITHPLIIGCGIICLITFIMNPSNILGVDYTKQLICFIFSALLFAVLYNFKISNPFTKYVSKYNYEIYLVHHRIFILFFPALISIKTTNIQIIFAFLVLAGMVFLVAEFIQKISNKVLTLFLPQTI